MNSNILLTGSSGFLGKEILKVIDNDKVYTLNRSNSTFNYDLSKNIPLFNVSFEYVIHCAGRAHSIPNTESDKSVFFDTNVKGTMNLLEGLSKITIPKYFVYISSVSVYGLTEGKNINENHFLNANDAYGQSKIQAEKQVINWCKKNNVICTILRLPLIVGQNPPGNLKSMICGIRKGYYFNIAGGNAKKSMVLASDIAKFILKAAVVGGTYNLTDGIHPTFNDLSKSISQSLDKSFVPNMPLLIANVLAKIGDKLGNTFPLNSQKLYKIHSTLTFDDSKARKSFGWDPNPVLEWLLVNPQ